MIDLTEPSRSRVLVVGAGFIGSHIVHQLLREGHEVRALSRSIPEAVHARLLAGAELLIGDATDPVAVAAAMAGVEWVIFGAGGLVPSAAQLDPIPDLALALRPLLTVLDAVAHCPDTEFTYLSSGGTVYGRSELIRIPEDHPTNPVTAYGVMKLAGEKFTAQYSSQSGTPIRILRCANVYGEGQRTDRGQGAVGAFLAAMRQGRPVTVFGDGHVVRDFVHVRDVAAAVIGLRPSRAHTGTDDAIVNVGTGTGVSLTELLAAMEALLDVKATVAAAPSRPFDVDRNVLDIARLVRLTGINPMPLRDGLQLTIAAETGSRALS